MKLWANESAKQQADQSTFVINVPTEIIYFSLKDSITTSIALSAEVTDKIESNNAISFFLRSLLFMESQKYS